jgi:hypothetical protein
VNRAFLAGAAMLALAGCPLPQPLPSYPKGTVTPPRILMDGITFPESAIQVPSACSGAAPSYDLAAQLIDSNVSETITVRWFVDYDRHNSSRCVPATPQVVLEAPGDQASDPTRRDVPPYRFVPYDHAAELGGSTDPTAPGVLHVVELVVSNRFDPTTDDSTLCTPEVVSGLSPYRMPASEGGVLFETQTYRWVFLNVPASPGVPCP